MTPQRARVISGMMGLNTVAPLFSAEEVKYIVLIFVRQGTRHLVKSTDTEVVSRKFLTKRFALQKVEPSAFG
jgi:hypothetical protein